MSETPRIQAASRRQHQSTAETPSPLDNATRALQRGRLSSADAEHHLAQLGDAIDSGLLDGNSAAVRSTRRNLQRALSEAVVREAPSASVTTSRRRRRPSFDQQLGRAFRSSGANPQQFLNALRRETHSSSALRRGLSSVTSEQAMQALTNAGATPEQAREALSFVGRDIARAFERDVQDLVLNNVGAMRDEVASARRGGPAFDRLFEQLSSPAGQRMLRSMRGMGLDTSSIDAAITQRDSGSGDDRAIEYRMRMAFQELLPEMQDVLDATYDEAANYLGETIGGPYETFQDAARMVAAEWGLPRHVVGADESLKGGSLVADALVARQVLGREQRGVVADARRFATAAASKVPYVKHIVAAAGTLLSQLSQRQAASRQGARELSGVGESGRAEELRREADQEGLADILRATTGGIRGAGEADRTSDTPETDPSFGRRRHTDGELSQTAARNRRNDE